MRLRSPALASLALAWAALLGVAPAHAQAPAPSPTQAPAPEVVHPWERLGDSLAGIYGWPNVSFHLAAAATTPPLAWWVDEPVQEYFQRSDPLGDDFGMVMLVSGGVAPIAVPAALYLSGLAADESELATAGAAAVQAVVVQAVAVTTLKWLTDRAGPFPNGDPGAERWNSSVLRDSKSATDFNFNPFDLEGGLRWPSGHTASNVALVSSLVAFYPRQPWLALVGYPAALAISVGMIEGDYHWLSDVVAGALIGHVIGWVVGSEFRTAYDAQRASTSTRTARAAARTPAARLRLTVAPLGLAYSGGL